MPARSHRVAVFDKPLISIVMLCYNHERFVAEALDGVLSQIYSPLEIVIVDDCSQDATAEIVGSKLTNVKSSSNIRFIRNAKNLGLLPTCETGIRNSKGDFIVFTCDDDVMEPSMVADITDFWCSTGASLVSANANLIDDKSTFLGRTQHDTTETADDSFETLARDGANACCFGAAMGFERALYTAFGMPPLHLNNIDILYPFYAYLLNGARYLNKPLLRYRIHGQNNALSLIDERADERGKLEVRDRIFHGHIAHAVAMMEALDRLNVTMPDRYREVAPRINPLLNTQIIEMAKKLVRNQIALAEFGRPSHQVSQGEI
jgi:glycosyltransferase involved in cell wall biosynthesis